ncbi:MAG: MATE family efflux transporter [Lentisphaeria bacterium]|nr:MATE family efflux transporter [Lentisphaeria bacterium]
MDSDKKYTMDMCHGPLFSKVLRFSIPLILSNLAALLFHAVDLVVLGQFTSSDDMAAVGATYGFIVLMLNVFWGIAAGVNVLTARYIGAKEPEKVVKTVHTSIAIAFLGGIIMGIISFLLTDFVLHLMATPEKIMDKARVYMQISCAGVPFIIFYSFGSAILRAVGDTKRPLIYMCIAGVVNVLLNMFFILVLKMSVAGVAIATQTAHFISAYLVIRALVKSDGDYKLVWKKIRMDWKSTKEILQIGIPAGFQGSMFTVTNIGIQATINTFGPDVIAGNTAALNLEGLIYAVCYSFYLASISFTGQNHGGKQYKRIIKSIFICIACSAAAVIFLSWGFILAGKQLLAIYNPEPEVIKWGLLRMKMVFSLYFLCALMDIISGSLRGLGHSLKPAIVIVFGVCVFRIVWIFTVFRKSPTLETLFTAYPVSWLLICIINGVMLYIICRRMLIRASKRQFCE